MQRRYAPAPETPIRSVGPERCANAAQGRGALYFALALALLVLWFGNLGARRLLDPDEGRYAEIPRELLATGNWVTPRLDGLLYFEKPPLQYWATAAAYRAFGENELTSRLWVAITGLAGVLLVLYAGTRRFGRDAGLYGAAVLAGGLLYFGAAQVNTLDMGVAFFMSVSLVGFVLAQGPSAGSAEAKGWIHAAWTAAALAVLSKGLIGVVLPGAALLVYTVLYRDASPWRRLHLKTGVPLFLLICVPWFVAVIRAHPDFARFFFVQEHFERFLTPMHHRDGVWWYFVPILLAGTLPWTLPMIAALVRAWRERRVGAGFDPRGFLLTWTAVIFVFFSVSDSKLPAYILPVVPAMALLTGDYLTRVTPRTLAGQLVPAAVVAGAVLLAVPFLGPVAHHNLPPELYAKQLPWLLASAATLLLAVLVAIGWLRRARITAAVLLLSAATMVTGQFALESVNRLSPVKSAYDLAQGIKPHLTPDTVVFGVRTYPQTLPFYLKRTLTLVSYRGELAYGIDQDPGASLPDFPAFERAWRRTPDAIAVMSRDTFDLLSRSGLPMQIIARDPVRVAVIKP